MDPETQAITLENVSFRYGQHAWILKGISLHVNRGEVFGLVGPSGSGKTTLVQLMAGLSRPTGGKVEVLGCPMPTKTVAGEIGYMAQADALYNELNGFENLEFFAGIYGLKGGVRRRRVAELLELVGLGPDALKPVFAYSGGMKRRLSLAIALLADPSILLLDEPTVGIDPLLRRNFWAEFERLRQSGRAIVITTHVMDEAERVNRVALLRDGHLLTVAPPHEIKLKTGQPSLEEAFLALAGAR